MYIPSELNSMEGVDYGVPTSDLSQVDCRLLEFTDPIYGEILNSRILTQIHFTDPAAGRNKGLISEASFLCN